MILSVLIIFSIFGFLCRSEEKPVKSKCDDCYLKHYETKGCSPVYDRGSDCPVRYNCPEKVPDNPSVCIYKGKTYKLGDDVDIGSPCQGCKCRRSYVREGVDVICFSIECGRDFGMPLGEGCYWAYKENKCCPDEQCWTNATTQKMVCEHGGKKYRYGERFYTIDSKTCICNEKWSGIIDGSCTPEKCLILDLNEKKLQDGCIPIYYENMCCPIDFICGPDKYGVTNTTTISSPKEEDIDSGITCVFNGVHYQKGQNLDLNREDNCITCSCKIPPDFTCIRRKCPRPPNYNYANCKSKYTPGECCPAYDCVP